jgi:hypothetical protein
VKLLEDQLNYAQRSKMSAENLLLKTVKIIGRGAGLSPAPGLVSGAQFD